MRKLTGKAGPALKTSRSAKATALRTPAGNGMETFTIHAFDKVTAPMVDALRQERRTTKSFAPAGAGSLPQLDPETAATRYLEQALHSKAVPSFAAPRADEAESEFESLGRELIPLTGTTIVKFRQMLNKIPVYGSLVTIELDVHNDLVSIGASLGRPTGVDPVAAIAAADALKAVVRHPPARKRLDGVTPRLHYYFDRTDGRWRLVYLLEDVAVSPARPKKDDAATAARFAGYIVDAQSGKVIAELPRTSSRTSSVDDEAGGFGAVRRFLPR